MHVGSLGWEKTPIPSQNPGTSHAPQKGNRKNQYHIKRSKKPWALQSCNPSWIERYFWVEIKKTGHCKRSHPYMKGSGGSSTFKDFFGRRTMRVFDSEWNLLHANTTRRDPGKQVSRWTSGSAMAVCHKILSYSRNSKKVNVHVAKYGRLETTRKYKK